MANHCKHAKILKQACLTSKTASPNKPCTKKIKQRIQDYNMGTSPLNREKMPKELKNLTQKKRPLQENWNPKLYRRTGIHILGYNCISTHFSQCAMAKTFDKGI
jgi:hypothetical protein